MMHDIVTTDGLVTGAQRPGAEAPAPTPHLGRARMALAPIPNPSPQIETSFRNRNGTFVIATNNRTPVAIIDARRAILVHDNDNGPHAA